MVQNFKVGSRNKRTAKKEEESKDDSSQLLHVNNDIRTKNC
jgi:hypothetical protein